MTSKKIISLFAAIALAGSLFAGGVLATENASTTQQQKNDRDARGMMGLGLGLGMGKINNNGSNNSDQVSRIQAMIQQLQEQLAKLTGGSGSASTTVSSADLDCAKAAVATREQRTGVLHHG